MKISQINAVFGAGSTGVIVKDLQNLCQVEEIECEVLYALAENAGVRTIRIGSDIENKLHSLLCRISGKQGYYSCLSTRQLLRHYDSYKPDIIHLHNLHSSYIDVPMLLKYAAKRNIAVVVTLHDCWFYTGGCTHYTHSNCFKWKEHCGKCPQRYEEFPALLWDSSNKQLEDRRRLFGNIKNLTAVGVSQWIVDEAQQSVFKNARCLSIHNGIDTDFFHPVDGSSWFQKVSKGFKGLEQKPFIILCPANKWFLDINRETFDYFASHLTDDMRMVFIGNGVDECRLTDKMINIGFVSSREKIRAIYSACDVMVNCTREESLSLLNVEVQACGTPVITYSNTGVKETVDGKCGFAVENGNPEAAWNAMMQIKQNGKAHYSDACQKWVKQEFDKNKNYMKYIELYKQISTK